MNIVQIYRLFPTEADCLVHLEKVRWQGKPTCPYCKSTKQSSLSKESRYHCNNCNTSYSVTVGTIFHNTKLDLQKWFLAVSIILNAKKGISARQLARDLEVNPNTAWYVGMRIRKAMLDNGGLLQGIIEMDECFIGGKPRKGNKPYGNKRGRGTSKMPVVGLVERGGSVKATAMRHITSKRLRQLVRRNVKAEKSRLMTDEYKGYTRMREILPHSTVNHQFKYVDGDIHTNTIEGFWSLLKRGIIGQYHKVSVPYLQSYINEFAYRYNNRKNDQIFDQTILRAVGGEA